MLMHALSLAVKVPEPGVNVLKGERVALPGSRFGPLVTKPMDQGWVPLLPRPVAFRARPGPGEQATKRLVPLAIEPRFCSLVAGWLLPSEPFSCRLVASVNVVCA